MSKTYTELQSRFVKLTKNSNSENTSFGQDLLNESIRTIASINSGNFPWLETVETIDSVASQQKYVIPNNIRHIVDIYYVVGGNTYMPTIIYDSGIWKQILASNLGESNFPQYVYIQNRTMYFAPTPSTSTATITIRGRLNIRDLGIEDYTTGTVITTTVGGTTITGTGTTWEDGMVGRYIKINNTTASNGGDGFWYKIASVTSATILELATGYQGSAITAGSATYTIGEVSPIPDAYSLAPVYRAAAIYWEYQNDEKKSQRYWTRYDGGVEAGLSSNYGGIIGQMFEAERSTVEGAYISPNQITQINPNNPQQDASGFS